MITDMGETAKGAGLGDGYMQWKKDMDDYCRKKKEFQGVPEPYKKVTNEFIKKQDVMYNPITQTYTNPSREQNMRQKENANMIEVLAKNKDRSLRYEQTYNILNFENKLRGLEDRADYPKEKPWYFIPGKDTLADFNIISNVDMTEHHFAAPEKRPPPAAPVRERGKAIEKPSQREYNIVNNRYVEHHDAKEEVNAEIQRAEAAKEFWRTRDYDPIRAEFYDGDKEKTFVSERSEKAKTHGKEYVKKLPATV
jgi:hypothetical protein